MNAVLLMGRWLLAFDERIFVRVRALHRPLLTRLMRTFTALGDTGTWVLQGLLLAALPGFGHRAAVQLALSAGVATLAVQVLKRVLRRPRPSKSIVGFEALAADPDAFSFPSGHTAVAFAVAVGLRAVLPQFAGVEFALAGCVAVSRVYLGAHYPLDVACGALLGICCGAGAGLL